MRRRQVFPNTVFPQSAEINCHVFTEFIFIMASKVVVGHRKSTINADYRLGWRELGAGEMIFTPHTHTHTHTRLVFHSFTSKMV